MTSKNLPSGFALLTSSNYFTIPTCWNLRRSRERSDAKQKILVGFNLQLTVEQLVKHPEWIGLKTYKKNIVVFYTLILHIIELF